MIKQPNQFSYLNGGKKIVKPTYKPSEQQVKGLIEELAFEAVMDRFEPNLEKEYLFFHTVDLKKIPKFSKQGKNHRIIGNHIFIGV